MWKYVLKRIGLIVLTAFIILSISYILIQTLPVAPPEGTTAIQISFYDQQVELGYYWRVTLEDVIERYPDAVRLTDANGTVYYYQAVPVLERYVHWLGNIFTQWNWGVSTAISVNRGAMEIIMERLPVTIELNVISIIVSTPLGIGIGVWAALKKNKPTDTIISTLIMVFISVPSFVLISFMLLWFTYYNDWLPQAWPSAIAIAADPSLFFRGLVIPVLALSFGSIAGFGRYTRAELCEVMNSEFLLLARTKGLTKGQSIISHALRNSMVPIVPMIIGQFISIMSGSMVLEQLYSIPGTGQLFVTALNSRDYAVVMVDMAMYTIIGLFATLLVDLSYGVVDPRIRMGQR